MLISPEDSVHEVASDLCDAQISLELGGNLVLSRLLRDPPLESIIQPRKLTAPVAEHDVYRGLEPVAHDGVSRAELVQRDVPLPVEGEPGAGHDGLLDHHKDAGHGAAEAPDGLPEPLRVFLQQLLAPGRTLQDLDQAVVVAHQPGVEIKVTRLADRLLPEEKSTSRGKNYCQA